MIVSLIERKSRKRTYLMCPPEYFVVEYSINPWMDVTAPVDTELALKQWEGLRETLTGLGHTVHVLDAGRGLPDMVYAANGAFVVDGIAYGARFRYPQRSREAVAHRLFHVDGGRRYITPGYTNEGEGDFVYLPGAHGGMILAGYGFRTEPAAHAEAQEYLGRPAVSLRLVDPLCYHLDVALAVLDDANIAYYPGAFSASSQRVLRRLFPEAVIAQESDALVFGLNLVSDGYNIVLNSEADALAARLRAVGYRPVPVELTELKKGGGSVKCCVAELHA
jgi:N-dimethylarginine dimethylaminohydrolase